MHTHTRTANRGRALRDMATDEEAEERLTTMIVGTYREMPGLCLHLDQAARLFGVSVSTCHRVLERLVIDGALHHTADGRYRIPNP